MKSAVLISLGFLALLIGAIGVFLPIMPTTPFVLVAAACFGSSSPKLHSKLKKSKYFGEFVQNYQSRTGVSKNIKIKAIIFLWITLSISAIAFHTMIVILILSIVGITVTIHIATLKSKTPPS